MKYNKMETRDFKCRLCGTTWLKFIENKKQCPNSILQDGRHNFDFGKPINVNSQGKQLNPSDNEGTAGKITFQ
jgi:hypothetical protein